MARIGASSGCAPGARDRLLDRKTLDGMHRAALDMLAATGIRVEHEEIRAAISRRAGFKLEAGRILIAGERVEAWRAARLKLAPQSAGPEQPAPSGFTAMVSDRSLFVGEADGVTVRPATRADAIESARLLNALAAQGVRGTTACVPCDVPEPCRGIEQFMIGAEFSRRGGSSCQVTDILSAGFIYEMNEACGNRNCGSVWCPSPLILGGPELDIFWQYRNRLVSCFVGAMPIMGLTAPCDPVAAFTLAIAECLGGAAILQELAPDLPVGISPHPEPADMRTGAIVFGSPEWELLDIMHRDVHAYYGGSHKIKLLYTTAPGPNPQAAAERAASAMSGALMGYREFGPIGQLSLDEVYSPAMLILDLEIIRHAMRVARGVAPGAGLRPAELPAMVDAVIRGNMLFAEHETTVRNMRNQYWRPEVFRRQGLNQWLAAGRPDLVRAAQAEAKRLAATDRYEAPADRLRELRRICDRARAALLARPAAR